MAHEVILPLGDALADECQLILTTASLLVHLDAKVHHLARHIGESLALGELVRNTADGDAKQCRTCRHSLRNDDGAPLVVYA